MIVLDLNQVMFSTLLVSIGSHTNIKMELPLLRHMAVNVIRANRIKFRVDYGDLVLVSDSRRYWRKEIFPYYKASRKKSREKSDIDWPSLYKAMDAIKEELQAYFPYKYLCVEGAEADDIIATLCELGKKTLIVSGDKDFIQLHNDNIKQYDPVHKRFLTTDDPKRALFEHILKGDAGDGIPNIRSADNCFVIGQKQKPMTKKLMESLTLDVVQDPESEYNRNFMRNKTLIDLTMIPVELKQKIKDEYIKQVEQDRSKLRAYFMQNRMKQHLENITDF